MQQVEKYLYDNITQHNFQLSYVIIVVITCYDITSHNMQLCQFYKRIFFYKREGAILKKIAIFIMGNAQHLLFFMQTLKINHLSIFKTYLREHVLIYFMQALKIDNSSISKAYIRETFFFFLKMRLCRTISSVKKLYVMLSLITSALGWKTIFRKQMLNKIFWDGSINVILR